MQIHRRRNLKRRRRSGGFSLVEMAVAAGMAAAVLTAGAIAVGSIGANSRRLSSYGSIELGNALLKKYFPNDPALSGDSIDAYTAPNYGRAASADIMRDLFWSDVSNANAVFCLGRTNPNTIHTGYLPYSDDLDGRALDSPEAFRQHLATVQTQSSLIFQSWRGHSTYDNGSIFIIQPSIVSSFLAVRAVYDIDFHTTTNPPGTYVSVKRYSQDKLTDYYDVFYPVNPDSTAFKPLFVMHERRARLRKTESTGTEPYDEFKVAADMPFYFIWWPDPASAILRKQTTSGGDSYGTIASGDPNPLPYYADMAGRTSYFFTVPVFPTQL